MATIHPHFTKRFKSDIICGWDVGRKEIVQQLATRMQIIIETWIMSLYIAQIECILIANFDCICKQTTMNSNFGFVSIVQSKQKSV